jgi:hypothetical protein
MFSVFNANLSRPIHTSQMQGKSLMLRSLGNEVELRFVPASPNRHSSTVLGSSGTVVLSHAGNLLNTAEKVHACIMSNDPAYYNRGAISAISAGTKTG